MYKISNWIVTKLIAIPLSFLIINLGIVSCKKDNHEIPGNKVELDEYSSASIKTNSNGNATIISDNYGEVQFEIKNTDNANLQNILIEYCENDSIAFVKISSESGEYRSVYMYGDLNKIIEVSSKSSEILVTKSATFPIIIIVAVLVAASGVSLGLNAGSAVKALIEINDFWLTDKVIDEYENNKYVKTASEITDYARSIIEFGSSTTSCLITLATFSPAGLIISATKTPALEITKAALKLETGVLKNYLLDWIFDYKNDTWPVVNPDTRFWVSTYTIKYYGEGGKLIVLNGINLSLYDGALPCLETSNVTSITSSSAISGGKIINAGNLFIEAKGICWNTSNDPTIENCIDYTSAGQGSDTFISELGNLTPNTTYYVRAYGKNYEGVGYGNSVSFITSGNTPIADFTASPTTITEGQTVQFTDLSTNNPIIWSWNFGDGGTSNIQNPLHTFTNTGTYTVGLTVCNNYGADSKTINNYIIVTGNGCMGCETGTVSDIDGNSYNTVKIGDQWWMAENLKTTKYRDGTIIPNVTNNAAWSNLTSGAYSDYYNTPSYSITYGKLYNLYAVNDAHDICPTGWHVPTDTEWHSLVLYVDSIAQLSFVESVTAGGKLKKTGTTYWFSPNTGATNETGFTALPGGHRSTGGSFLENGFISMWWSSNATSSNAWIRIISYDNSNVSRNSYSGKAGVSVRCIKDN
jgi:uncharacterized protein (TIGR02145 family)